MPTIEELQADLSNANSELADLKARLETVNGEAKGLRLQASRYKTQLETLQSQHDTLANEREKLDERHAAEIDRVRIDLTAQLNAKDAELTKRIGADKEKRTAEMLTDAASKLGLVDPDGFLKVLDRTDLRIADDGTVENAEEIVAKFRTEKPYFFGAVQRPGVETRTTSTTRVTPRATPPTIPDARAMSPEDRKNLRRQIVSGTFSVQ